MEVDITELTELDAEAVSGVSSPANGMQFIMIKATASDDDQCPLCKGKGTIREGNMKCPECKGLGTVSKSDSKEADEIEEEVTDDANAEKADESSKQQNDLPDSAFAYIEPGGKKDSEGKTTPRSKRHYPVHDKPHADNAFARAESQIQNNGSGKAIAEKALPKIKAAQKKFGTAAKKGDVQDALNGEQTPKGGAVLDGSQSGVNPEGSGEGYLKITELSSMAPGLAREPSDNTLVIGGETTYRIPVEDDRVRVTDTTRGFNPQIPVTTDPADIVNPQALGKAFAGLTEALEKRIAEKNGNFLESPPNAPPSSGPWESYDSATLEQVAECLASCCHAVGCIETRERTEAINGEGGDFTDAWELEAAGEAIDAALAIVARLSFHEGAEAKGAEKAGKVLSDKNLKALEKAHEHLTAVLASHTSRGGKASAKAGESEKNDSKSDSKESDEMERTMTKSEFDEVILAAEKRGAEKAAKKAAKKARKLAEKNANNGGDVTTADVHATSEADANDVNAIPNGGSVDPQYVNKELADVQAQLTQISSVVEKIARRPQRGGPSLDGQAHVADEGRQGEVATKSETDAEIETLEKALASTSRGSNEQAAIGERLARARLRKLHEDGVGV